MASKTNLEIASLEHPYILFKKKDIPVLIKRTETEPYKSIWKALLSKSPKEASATENAFIYALTGDVTRGEAAHKVLAELCARPNWGKKAKLNVSGPCFKTGLVYDMIYSMLTPEQRKTYAKAIRTKGIDRLYKDTMHGWWSERRQHNYSPVFNASYGIAALAILKEDPEALIRVERAADRIRLFLCSQDPAGGFGEGINYWCMTLRTMFPFMDGIRNVMNRDLYQEPYLKDATGYFVLYALSPDRRSTLNFNDAGINRIYDQHVMARLASACGWQQIAWVVENDIVPQWNKPDGTGNFYSFLWYDPNVPRKPLNTLPRSRYFAGIGWAVMRTGWDKNALQFGIISAPKFFGNHEHADRGSIIFNAYGERLICDSGKPVTYGDPIIESFFRESAAHNLLLVDGEGQTTQAKLTAPGRMSLFMSSAAFDYVKTENAGPYNGRVNRWDRHVVFATQGFVVLFDDAELPQKGDMAFRLHSPGSRRIRMEESHAMFPGDNGGDIPRISTHERRIQAMYGENYQETEWWKTGLPVPPMTEWKAEEEETTDLLVKSFSATPSNRTFHSGYQDYRYPATYMDAEYRNVQATKTLTILYPRSPDMKNRKNLPNITGGADKGSVWVKVKADGRQHLIITRPESGEVNMDNINTDAQLSALALNSDGKPEAIVLVSGTRINFGTSYALHCDSPIVASISSLKNSIKMIVYSDTPSGADLRLILPKPALRVTANEKPYFASFTPRKNKVEFHIPPGKTELAVHLETTGK